MTAIASHRRFEPGKMIFLEGDVADALHLLVEGRVAVRVATPAGDVATLTVLGPGDCFGEVALLGGYHRRTASIIALEAVETLVVSRREFDELRLRQPAVERFLVAVLARQVNRLTAHLTEALYIPVETRLARRLCDLAATYSNVGDSSEVVLPLTQTDLASIVGTSRQTCNRMLREFEASGLLRLERGRTTITDLRRLRDFAGG